MTGDKVLRQIRNSWIVELENWWEQEAVQSSGKELDGLCNWLKWWEQEAVQSPVPLDSCLPRLR